MTRLSTPLFSSKHLKVMGRVAELRMVKKKKKGVSADPPDLLDHDCMFGILDRVPSSPMP